MASLRFNFLFISAAVFALALFFLATASFFPKNSILVLLSPIILAGSLYYFFRGHYNIQLSADWLIDPLLFVKEKIVESHQRLLNSEQAAFLSGMTVGERGGFSDKFLEKLSLSGTRHLVVLSGSNLTIISLIIFGLFNNIFSKGKSFVISLLAILGLVAMTGFEVSAVRASLMALIFGFSKQIERLYSPRNAIALAGLIIVLLNPRALVFDIGFQLSFLAILGVVYLLPALKNIAGVENKGLLDWKEAALTTVSAQLAVAPVLIVNFSNFTLTSFAANILILAVVPLAMIIGFFLPVAYFIFPPAAIVIGWLASFLLSYQIFVINLFSRLSLPFNPDFGLWGIFFYYAALIFLAVKFYGKRIEL